MRMKTLLYVAREFTSRRIIASATLPVANQGLLDDTGERTSCIAHASGIARLR
jgi:hypothetical protein